MQVMPSESNNRLVSSFLQLDMHSTLLCFVIGPSLSSVLQFSTQPPLLYFTIYK